MIRPWHIWTLFGICLAVVLAAMIWLSATVLRLERAGVEARRQAAVEENVRLALWRMDSALAPLIARESARPYFAYSSFYPAERAYTRMFDEIEYGQVLVPSPLLTQVSPYILLHFQIDGGGVFSSPQVPVGNMRDLAEARYIRPEDVAAAVARLAELEGLVSRDSLLAELPVEPPRPASLAQVLFPTSSPAPPNERAGTTRQRADTGQFARSWVENQARSRAISQSNSQVANVWNAVSWAGDVDTGPLQPLWRAGNLLLARRVIVEGAEYVQGCWLDWPAVSRWLSSEIGDLFPHARLEPANASVDVGNGRSLAALPVLLAPGPPALDPVVAESPMRLSLIIAWVCTLLAAAAVVILLVGTVSLSERRGAFVSAVTHELRTPLTTFRLYTDMLADGMVKDEHKRERYLRTLHAEATRLGHLVENVLAYARLERGRAPTQVGSLPLPDLLQRVHDRLADRATQAGMQLVVEPLNSALETTHVQADASVVEQILFNLVDNACKYAAGAEEKVIRLSSQRDGGLIALRVRDHGPGIPQSQASRLFRPFRKSAREAAHTAPGVGLGLALSRRLAHRLGGDLRLVSGVGRGACFELTLRQAQVVE